MASTMRMTAFVFIVAMSLAPGSDAQTVIAKYSCNQEKFTKGSYGARNVEDILSRLQFKAAASEAMVVGTHFSLIFILLLHFSFAIAIAIEFDYPAIFNFGDSNSDTGIRVAAGLESIDLPYGQSYFKGPAGRFCDGRLVIDFLSNLFPSVLI
ncbi:uncharacterized protein A4U43_C07F8990 [Asparagus officinalis]|uniref:Alpha-L-fucosidase n=1 Tax=Asparagus officinalis TaxID=4686 RepID=A0A5P1EFL8_ASPOF|nr:uncharacterized protein A4U43_C07F8990 [Asparagus officinalis]